MYKLLEFQGALVSKKHLELLAFQSGDLVVLVEIRESGIPSRESEAASAARDGDVAEFGGREIERGALEAERAMEIAGAFCGAASGEAGGEQPSERQRSLADFVHYADAVCAAQNGRILRVCCSNHVVERDDAALEAPQPLLLLSLLLLQQLLNVWTLALHSWQAR